MILDLILGGGGTETCCLDLLLLHVSSGPISTLLDCLALGFVFLFDEMYINNEKSL